VQALEQQLEFRFGLRVSGEQNLTRVGGRDAHVDHLHGGNFLKRTARREPGYEGFELSAERDVQTVREEGDEHVRLYFTNQRYRWGKSIDESVKATNRRKSSVRAKVEHVFGVIKRVFGFQKVCYRGLTKNLHRLEVWPGGHRSAGESVLVAQEIAECVGNVSAKAAELGFSRRQAKTFPRKRAPMPDRNEIPMPSWPSYPVFQTFL